MEIGFILLVFLALAGPPGFLFLLVAVLGFLAGVETYNRYINKEEDYD